MTEDKAETANAVADVSSERSYENEFASSFAKHLDGFNYSSTSSQKYKPLEKQLAALTGWAAVGMKYVADSKNIKNRISESQNRPDKPIHAVVFVPRKLVNSAVEAAKELVSDGRFLALGISAADDARPAIGHLVYDTKRVEPFSLISAFPEIELHAVESAAHGETVNEGSLSLAACAEDTGFSEETVQAWLTKLERKKHLVFQGPPGTGKTFVARRLARLLVSRTGGVVDLVQFHPSYAYEDFVQGIRPKVASGQVTYSLQDGRFLDFCRLAREQPDASFVLIIDEMNRGSLSRIFGELLFLLEYRDQSIVLSQGGKPFSIPKNVYVIGTMNTADRSIALVDYAIRRRFAFVFLGPDYDVLKKHLEKSSLPSDSLIEILQRLNATIGDKNYQIGTSFFLGNALPTREALRHIWEGEVEPYLEEYFFDQPSRIDEFRWKVLVQNELAPWVGLRP